MLVLGGPGESERLRVLSKFMDYLQEQQPGNFLGHDKDGDKNLKWGSE